MDCVELNTERNGLPGTEHWVAMDYLELNTGRGIKHLEYLVHALHQGVQVLAAVRILMLRHHLNKGDFP